MSPSCLTDSYDIWENVDVCIVTYEVSKEVSNDGPR